MSTDRLLLPPELDPLEVVVAPDLCEGVGPLSLRAQAAVQGEALGAVPLLWETGRGLWNISEAIK